MQSVYFLVSMEIIVILGIAILRETIRNSVLCVSRDEVVGYVMGDDGATFARLGLQGHVMKAVLNTRTLDLHMETGISHDDVTWKAVAIFHAIGYKK